MFQFRAHKNDNQTCEYFTLFSYGASLVDNEAGIVRHGQQPGNDGAPKLDGPFYTANWTERTVKPGSVPLPGNDDNRGSVGLLPSIMSYVAVSIYSLSALRSQELTFQCTKQGKGMNPDTRVPEKPLNMTQPTPQRVNAAGTHHYTKVCYVEIDAQCALVYLFPPAAPKGLVSGAV